MALLRHLFFTVMIVVNSNFVISRALFPSAEEAAGCSFSLCRSVKNNSGLNNSCISRKKSDMPHGGAKAAEVTVQECIKCIGYPGSEDAVYKSSDENEIEVNKEKQCQSHKLTNTEEPGRWELPNQMESQASSSATSLQFSSSAPQPTSASHSESSTPGAGSYHSVPSLAFLARGVISKTKERACRLRGSDSERLPH
jgi:hypothetical protein